MRPGVPTSGVDRSPRGHGVTDPAAKTVPEGAHADEIPTEVSKRPVYGDRYAVEAEIGHGGMGTVFRARDLKLRRCVALKVLKARDGPDPRRRERRERGSLRAPPGAPAPRPALEAVSAPAQVARRVGSLQSRSCRNSSTATSSRRRAGGGFSRRYSRGRARVGTEGV